MSASIFNDEIAKLIAAEVARQFGDFKAGWLSPKAAALHCNCSRSHLHKMTHEEKLLTLHQFGGKSLYKRDELDAAIESGVFKHRDRSKATAASIAARRNKRAVQADAAASQEAAQ